MLTTVPTPRCHDVRALVVDDHPALREGLRGLLDAEAGVCCVGAVDSEAGLWDAMRAHQPDLVILDYFLGRRSGLTTCFTLKQLVPAPRVVLYSAYADDVFAVPAAVAQADATVSKSAPVGDLLRAVREVAGGRRQPVAVTPELMQVASARLRASDLPIAGMLISRVPLSGIADILNLPLAEARVRAHRVIGLMQSAAGGEPREHQLWAEQGV